MILLSLAWFLSALCMFRYLKHIGIYDSAYQELSKMDVSENFKHLTLEIGILLAWPIYLILILYRKLK